MRRANGEGSVYYDEASGRFVAAVTGMDGKRHKRSATTRKGANSKLRELLNEQQEYGRIASPRATLCDLMVKWKTTSLEAATIAPNTKANKLWAYERLQRALGSEQLATINADRIERALRQMADEGLGKESLIKIRSVLNQIFNFGVRRDLIRKNPVPVVELPADLPASDPGRALTVEQARRLLAVSWSDRLHGLWCTMLMLGLRPGEALGLHWADVDLDTGILRVQRALRNSPGGGFEITDDLKTAKSRRTLSMPEPLIAALRRHRSIQDAERSYADDAWSSEWPDLVFTTQIGTPIGASNLRRSFRVLTEQAGLGVWSPNELRHTAVSIMSDSGVALERIADVVGHDGTRMTSKVYRHVLTPSVSHAVAPMNELFGDSPSNTPAA